MTRVDKFEIETSDLVITRPSKDARGSWSFKYRAVKNGKLVKVGKLDSTFTVPVANMRDSFKRGYATELVLGQL